MTGHFPPAPCDVDVADRWPPGRLDPVTRAAYASLEHAGLIRILSEHTDPANGWTTLRYCSQIPPAWIRDALRDERDAGEQLRIDG